MRSKLLAILLSFYSFSFGQVPNTDSFTLDTVIKVVEPATNDLSACFAAATKAYFDPLYDSIGYAPVNSLLRFRNYTPVVGGCVIHGYLYNWYAATDARNIAPEGWRVATDTDYETLVDYMGAAGDYTSTNTIAPYLKDTKYWDSGLEGNNQYGFNLRAGGFRVPPGDFIVMGTSARLITSNVDANIHCWLSYDYYPNAFYKGNDPGSNYGNLGYSIRLVKEDSIDPGTVTGNDGKIYPTIKIGDQVWISCNLAETKYRNGDTIPTVTDNTTWAGLTTGAKCAYNNDQSNVGCDE